MNAIFDLLLKPFSTLPPLAGLMWISALSGLMMILIFKKTSNQQAISALRRKMGSRALGMLLFLESPITVIKLALKLIADNFIYLWHLLKPMLIITIPFILIAAQLDARYSRQPLSQNDIATVTITWEDSIPTFNSPVVESGLIISPILSIPDSLEQSFSFTGENGLFISREIGVRLGSDKNNGAIFIRGAEKPGIVQALIRPWNTASNDNIHSMKAFFPEKNYNILGARWGWFTIFLVFSSLWAIVGAVVFKVKI